MHALTGTWLSGGHLSCCGGGCGDVEGGGSGQEGGKHLSCCGGWCGKVEGGGG